MRSAICLVTLAAMAWCSVVVGSPESSSMDPFCGN
jgi:hypothetical protein